MLEETEIGDDYPYFLNIGLFRWTAADEELDFSDAFSDTCMEYTGRFSDSPFNGYFATAQYCAVLAPMFSTLALLIIYLDVCMVSFPPFVMKLLGTLYFIALVNQCLTFLVFGEERLCSGQDQHCELSGGAGATIAASCSYFLALAISCACIKGEIKPVCGIILEKMGCGKKDGDDDDDKDQKMKQAKEEDASGEETVEKKPVVVAAAQNTNDEEKPVEEEKSAAVAKSQEEPAEEKNSDPVDVEEGRATAAASKEKAEQETEPMAKPRTASSPQSESATPTSPSEVQGASMEHGAEGVESSETADSSHYNFIDKICCGSPTMADTLKK
jgi:hypothetical protein